jgi:hypothetical protein
LGGLAVVVAPLVVTPALDGLVGVGQDTGMTMREVRYTAGAVDDLRGRGITVGMGTTRS